MKSPKTIQDIVRRQNLSKRHNRVTVPDRGYEVHPKV